jgi:LPS sulfotransferase NodH
MTLPQPCFVIGLPRSGTTVFKQLLATHPRIVNFGEIFNEKNGRSYWAYLTGRIPRDPDVLLPSRSVGTFLDYISHLRARCTKNHPGACIMVLDVKYSQSHFVYDAWRDDLSALPKIFFLIKQQGWKAIDIRRDDMLALVVSNLVAMETKVYHSTGLPEGREHRPKVRLDVSAVQTAIETKQESYRRVHRHFRGYAGYLNILYEAMFVDQAGTRFTDALARQLSEFLGVPDHFDRMPRLRKLLTGDTYSYIENAEEIRARFASRPATPGGAIGDSGR